MKQFLKRLPSLSLFSTGEKETTTKFEMSLPFDYLNSYVEQILLQRKLENHQISSISDTQSTLSVELQQTATASMSVTSSTFSQASSSVPKSDRTEAEFQNPLESEILKDEEGTIQMLRVRYSFTPKSIYSIYCISLSLYECCCLFTGCEQRACTMAYTLLRHV